MASRSVTGTPRPGFTRNIPSAGPEGAVIGYHLDMHLLFLCLTAALADTPSDRDCCEHPQVQSVIVSVARIQAATLPTRPASEPGPAALLYRLYGDLKTPPSDLDSADLRAWQALLSFALDWRNRPENEIADAVPELGLHAEFLLLRHEGGPDRWTVHPCSDGGTWLKEPKSQPLPASHACAKP